MFTSKMQALTAYLTLNFSRNDNYSFISPENLIST
jgi:hypothetical protein